jgi:hypothetical protein
LDFDLDPSNINKMADFYTTHAMGDAILRSYQQIARVTLPRPETSRFKDGNMYIWVPKSGAQRPTQPK